MENYTRVETKYGNLKTRRTRFQRALSGWTIDGKSFLCFGTTVGNRKLSTVSPLRAVTYKSDPIIFLFERGYVQFFFSALLGHLRCNYIIKFTVKSDEKSNDP